ncbi:MAG: protein-disulfide reductase DsbD [Gammaproteobacteria bacterium]|nr:protein-disulfide reductase DsbD [Gammaproteobacteria bacterium]
MNQYAALFFTWLCLFFSSAFAADNILPAHKVFIPSVISVDENHITLEMEIKKGYYLYRQRFFAVNAAENTINLDDIQLSSGIEKNDPFSGKQSIWSGGKQNARIRIAYSNPLKHKSALIKLKYQGCQEGAICYPPQTTLLKAVLPTKVVSESQDKPVQTNQPTPWTPTAAIATKDVILGKAKRTPLLTEEQAFQLSIDVIDSSTLSLHWVVADGYYLYRDKIRVLDSTVSNIIFSDSQIHTDDFFGNQNIYRNNEGVTRLYFSEPFNKKELDIQFQGCADKGICYPIMQRRASITGDTVNIVAVTPKTDTKLSPSTANNQSKSNSIQRGGSKWEDKLFTILKDNIWLGFWLLLVAGLALAFTPCILPMLPILLGIITNQRSVTRPRAALLSSSYALGVATMMAVFGLVVAKTGINIQVIFQKPLWLILFASIFILMGLAMLGVFSIAMPSNIQNKIYTWQNKFQNTTPTNLFIVGALSTLVVGPCVAPPLIAILTFISATNDSFLGALYLFSLGLGMSLPLVIFATVSTSIPKTGELSRLVTRLFAMLMFGVGLWLISRLIPGSIALILWGLFMLSVAVLFWKTLFIKTYAQQLTKAISIVCIAIGTLWIAGGSLGNSNPLQPFTTIHKLPFMYVENLQQLEKELNSSKKPVMLDVYADWCVSCQEIEHFTFIKPEVTREISKFTLLKLDMTDDSDDIRVMLKKLGLIGPPSLLFFNNGKEITEERNIGVINAKDLATKLKKIAEGAN